MVDPEPRVALVVMGTRPEAIKLAPVVSALADHSAWTPRVCTTGQHGAMMRQTLATLDLKPDDALPLERAQPDLSTLAGELMIELGRFLRRLRPAVAIVQGDTT